jgi:hypothetical protein
VTTLLICVPACIYTMLGGVQAVTWTDVKTMSLTVFALVIAMVVPREGLPSGVGVDDALTIAGGTGGSTRSISVHADETYTFWSGMLGGLFLMLSYFGCDQSQVQRYLTAKSVDDGATSLLMSAFWKIPLQVLVLIVGVFTFLFYLFNQPPLLSTRYMRNGAGQRGRAVYEGLQREFQSTFAARRQAAIDIAAARAHRRRARAARARPTTSHRQDAALRSIRTRAIGLVRQTTGRRELQRTSTTCSPHGSPPALPIGIVGLWIAAIITAATDSIAAELNFAVDGVGHRFLQAPRPAERYRRPLLAGLALRDGFWGVFAGRDRRLREQPRIAHRGRQPVRVVLLRVDPRRLHARDPDAPRRPAPARSSG